MLGKWVRMLASHGLLVMLDLHAMVAGRWPDDGRVGGQGGRQALRSAWEKLADTFCDADQYWTLLPISRMRFAMRSVPYRTQPQSKGSYLE